MVSEQESAFLARGMTWRLGNDERSVHLEERLG
jgi:hypothetical protein